MRKRILAVALALIMLLSLMPVMALAAEKMVKNEQELKEAIASASDGDTITLGNDIAIAAPIVVTNKTITLNLAGRTISAESPIWDDSAGVKHWSLIEAAGGSDLTITGDGKLQTLVNDTYAIDLINGGKCTIEDGTIVGNVHAVYVLEGELTVNGGNYSVQQVFSQSQPYEFVLNCYDANYKNGTAKITVNGGTFAGFNPRNCEAEGQGTNFCAAGCKVAVDSTTDPDTYTVTKVEEGQMIVVPEQSDTQEVSASLEGTFTSSTDTDDVTTTSPDGTSGGANQPTGSVENNTVTVDMSGKDDGQTTTTASLNVAGETVSSLANNNGSLTIKSDVGKLEVSNDALQTISTKAGGSAVTLSIKVSESEENSVTYDFTATDASGMEVFDQTTSKDATITVTVAAPEGATPGETVYIYYIDGDTRMLEDTQTVADDKTVTWKVTHFSQREVTNTQDEATYTNSEGNEVTGTLAEAVENAKENTTITLNRDVTATDNAIAIENKSFKLDLNGHNIVKETGNSAIFSVKGGTLKVTGSGTIESKEGDAFSVTGNTTAPNTNKTEAVLVIEKDVRVKALWNCVWIAGNGAQADIYGSLTSTGIYAVIQGNGTKNNTTDYSGTIVNIYEGASVTHAGSDESAHMAIYQPQNGVLNIYGGTISATQVGSTAIEIRAGELNISGDAVINGGGGTPESDPNGNGSTTNNAAVAIAQHTTNQPIQVNITGGTLNGGAAVYESNPQSNEESDDNSVSVTIEDVTLNGNVNATGFGDITMSNVEITGDVNVTVDGVTSSGNVAILNSMISGNVPISNNNVTLAGCTNSDGESIADQGTEGKEAVYNGTSYATLEDAVTAANNSGIGGTITLLTDVELDGTNKGNNEGILTITKDVTLDGNGKTITAKSVSVAEGTTNGPSMIGIQGGAKVTVKNLTIDGEGADNTVTTDNTKHGLNVYGAGTVVTVEDVTIKNGNGYGIVVNGAQATINGLTTENNGWGGVNVDSKSGAASLTIEDADISELNSVKIENGTSANSDPEVEITGGTFRYITKGDEITEPNLTISGGKFATGTAPEELGAVNVKDYLADGLKLDSNGNVVKKGSSSGGGTVTPTPTPEPEELPFTDVAEGQWFYEAVQYVYDAKLMNGVTETTFEPDSTTTRGMIVTVLYRMAGEPAVTGESAFTDVAEGSWYADAINWAAANEIVNGYGDGIFAPDTDITREQMAAILYRYAQYKGFDVSVGEDTNILSYTDFDAISEYAIPALQWACGAGVIQGVTEDTLVPQGTATRAQVATILMRFCENVAK